MFTAARLEAISSGIASSAAAIRCVAQSTFCNVHESFDDRNAQHLDVDRRSRLVVARVLDVKRKDILLKWDGFHLRLQLEPTHVHCRLSSERGCQKITTVSAMVNSCYGKFI
jgi:hypothetical protein